jgi:hypothetical protein
MLDILLLCLLATAAVGLGYALGRRERRRGVVILYAVPRLDADIDIPRPRAERRWVS